MAASGRAAVGALATIRRAVRLDATRRRSSPMPAAGPLARRPPPSPVLLDRRQALATLLCVLQSQSMADARDESGQVRILSAASVRGLQVPYLFLAGLSEKSFPAPDRDDRLYSAGDWRRLIEAGLPLADRADRQQDEMLLFYEAVTSATRRLYLSYPAVGESGEPLAPSPYLKEVSRRWGRAGWPRRGGRT